MPIHQKKRKFEMGRTPAMTKIGAKNVRPVRGRGGNYKYRALRIDQGNFIWQSEQFASKSRILDVVYNATNNELVRTKTITKNTIVQVDATPFRKYYAEHYDVELGKKKAKEVAAEAEKAGEAKKKSRHVLAVIKRRQTGRVID